MIVVNASVFIDLLFEYDSVRTHSAEELFSILEEKGVPILEPDLFKVERSGQIARRVKKNLAPKISEEIFKSWSLSELPGSSMRHFPLPWKRDQGPRIHST
jgi:predicted nucleic acid-binding protein